MVRFPAQGTTAVVRLLILSKHGRVLAVSRRRVLSRVPSPADPAPSADGQPGVVGETAASEQPPRHGLGPGEALEPGERIVSPNGDLALVMQETDGNLVLYRGTTPLWSTGPAGPGARAVMQTDGNFVIYSAGGGAGWNSRTERFEGASLALQDDENIVISHLGRTIWTWSAGFSGHILRAGSELPPGGLLRSPDARFRLVMQSSDGNLVLYQGDTPLWASGAKGAGARAVMQSDGNFVIYLGDAPQFASRTAGFGGGELVLQDDGNAVIYHSGHPIWTRHDGYIGDRLLPGGILGPGAYLKSPDGRFTLVMQDTDSNLALYGPSGALWGFGSNGPPGARAIMQGDGNFVVYNGSTPVKHTSTAGNPGAIIRVQDDSNLVVYLGSTPLWDRHNGRLGGGGPGQYSGPDWWPLRGSNRVGCARNSTGPVCGGSYHSWWAIDVDAPEGQAIYASGAGLAKVFSNTTACSGFGRSVVVEHGGSTKSLYAHMSDFSAAIAANPGGVWVGPDTVIGYVGHTGQVTNCSFAHLHYEETTGGSFGSGAADPGELQACIGSTRVSYPSYWGRSSWNGLPGQTYTARSDHRNC